MSVLNRLLDKHDVILLICATVENRPWLRTLISMKSAKPKRVLQKYVDGHWREDVDVNVLTTHEAHCWLILHILLCDPSSRSKYRWDEHKKENVLRLRRWLNETVLDQIPTLMELQRAVDELTFVDVFARTDEKFKTMLVVEPVTRVMDNLSRRREWGEIAKKQVAELTSPETIQRDAQRLARLIDLFMDPSNE